FDDDQRRRQEKQERRQNPQADRGGSVVRRGRNPTRPEHRGDVEKQHVPKTHHAAKLLFGIGGGRFAHAVASSAGISASSSRKLRRKGSLDASKSAHVPKNRTLPSWRKITRSASFL